MRKWGYRTPMVRGLYLRAREIDAFKADAALAACFALAGVIESIYVDSGGHSRALTAVSAVAIAFPLAWRRRNTLLAVVAFIAIWAGTAQLNTFIWSNLTAPFVAVLLLAYTAGRHEPSRRMWLELGLLVILAVAGGVSSASDVLFTAIFLGCPALAGRGLRSRVLLQREMREKAARLEAERELRARRAVDEERSRIASELQAVVANGLSAMVVQAEAVPRLLATGQRAGAGQALATIEETGRDALAEMRRLLGVLRRDDDGPVLAPQPTLARAELLAARMQARGLHTTLSIRGEPVGLSPGVDLAGYRVLQEALASATRASGVSHADVSIAYGGDSVLVKVCDDRTGPDGLDPGMLRSLRERVGLYGGSLRATPSPSRGFEVEARLPVGGPK
jgi:signal transduction histidine kinase